ncbi:MAG: hypothetical protein Q9224_000752 [Gallowayella concinna]
MSQYLTGDKAGIAEFINRFDVAREEDHQSLILCSETEDTRRIGVLWSGDHLFEGTVETLDMLRSKGKQIVFVTNNSTKSRADYKNKLESMGIPASVDEVFGSSYSAAIYISRILALPPTQKTVFVLGESGIETELDSESIPHIGVFGHEYRYNLAVCGIAVSGCGGNFGAVGGDDGWGEADGVWEAEPGDDGCD